MLKRTLRQAARSLLRVRRRRAWRRVVGALSCVVVFCTVYALILPAITMEGAAGCGKEEHTHSESCYTQVTSTSREEPACGAEPHRHQESCRDETGALICGYADFFVHTHDERCLDEGGNLWCTLPEIEVHVHDDSCYTAQEAHVHTDECYTMERGELICQEPEQEGHTHSPEAGCYATQLICEIPESPVHSHTDECLDPEGNFICGMEEGGHTHGSDCYQVTDELICTQEEASGHQHTDECYSRVRGALECTEPTDPQEPVLVCEKPEAVLHQHTGECYALDEEGNRTEALICTQTVVLAHQHTDACFRTMEVPVDTQVLTCTEGSHTHGESCYDGDGNLICTQEEPHTHGEDCCDEEGNLICGKIEPHTHKDFCYDGEGNLVCKDQEAHTHGPLCYGTWVLHCTLEEHTHSPECYTDPTVDAETAEDWERSFASVALTGVWSEDTAAIGESQLGYRESSRNYTMVGGGKQGYTRYGAWYGDPYRDWNTLLAGFCLHYAGVPTEAFPWDLSCARWVELLTEKGLFAQAGGEYRPGRGDLAFLDADADGFADRVCLIQAVTVDEETASFRFTAIEGDCEGAVARKEYSGGTVLGYGVLTSEAPSVQAEEPDSWGYNDDGSIYWTRKALAQESLTAQELKSDTPYIITGRNRTHVMTAVPKAGTNQLEGERPATEEAYGQYAIWYFEAVEGGYRVYTGTETRRYLKIPDGGGLSVVGTAEEASVFTVAPGPEFPGCITMKCGGSYVNAYGDDRDTFTGWGSWTDDDNGSHLKILPAPTSVTETANRLDTVVSGNTVINLFDYWTNPDGQTAPDDSDSTQSLAGGINAGHNFKFYKNGHYYNSDLGTMNQLAAHAELRQGIVANKLGENGYPTFSGDSTVTGGATESLNYLFDPNIAVDGKQSYPNVGGLLRVNGEGYYSFDSREAMGEYRAETNTIVVYDKPGVTKGGTGSTTSSGQFFPMNQAPQVMTRGSTDPVMNHYFGVSITTRFLQRYDGHSDSHKTTPTTFHFQGDDDVWIFIDGVLVADLGGAHAAAGVDIDFSTGDVTVTSSDGSGAAVKNTHTLKQAYANAGVEIDPKDWNGETYANNTPHTLKFYYLERGNYDSNLNLKYNLAEIPPTLINKVNQYGQKVQGAAFAVYAADSGYNILSTKGGTAVSEPSEPSYDGAGNLLGSDGNILARSLYTGTTNAAGEMVFVDRDGMPYSLSELEDLFGSHFVLREIKVPDGYRLVSKDVHLRIWHGANQTILQCENTSASGSRAASTLQVTATDILYLQKPYNGSTTVEYCDETGNSTGSLFAVVFKYIGNVDGDGSATGLQNDDNWTPVYGSDEKGYKLVDRSGKTLMAAALEAARAAQGYGDVVFSLSPSSNMQLTLENLPGDITTYYRMLGAGQQGKTRYSVGYYWTPAASLAEATEESTYRVYTFAEATQDGTSYSSFDRVFGANIQVPNLINEVLVQKMDTAGNRINGATFALYQVQQQEDGSIHYRAEDGSYVPLGEDAAVGTDGVIVSGSVTVKPLKTGVTKDQNDGIHTGTTGFSNLNDGQYIVKEVQAPPGYLINTADVMLLVTGDTIYANAGTEDDGVTVGRGPGYVVKTLEKYASEGQIDNTLSWIYSQMRISGVSTSFADVGDESKILGYLTANNTSITSPSRTEAATTYLEYASSVGGAVFNYVPNEKRTVENGAQHPTGTRRLFTTVGWPYYEIYQDYDYGLTAKQPNADYERWDGNLMHLFARTTYIRVTDIPVTLQVKKVSATNENTVLSGAQFRLYRTGEGDTPEYYAQAGGAVTWETDKAKALTVTTGDDGLSQVLYGLSDGIYYLEETKAPAGYHLSSTPVKLELQNGTMTLLSPNPSKGHELDSGTMEDGSLRFTLTVPNNGGHKLPATGGDGVTAFYVFGSILLLGATLLLLRRRGAGKS